MSEDTDDHELIIEEGESSPNPQRTRTRRLDARRRSPSPAFESEQVELDKAQLRFQQQKLEDDKLIEEADIQLDGVSEEERLQLLMVLRESRLSVGSAGDQANTTTGPSNHKEEMEKGDDLKKDAESGELMPEDPLPSTSSSKQKSGAASRPNKIGVGSKNRTKQREVINPKVDENEMGKTFDAELEPKGRRPVMKKQKSSDVEIVVDLSEEDEEPVQVLQPNTKGKEERRSRTTTQKNLPEEVPQSKDVAGRRISRKKTADEEVVSASDEPVAVKKARATVRVQKAPAHYSPRDEAVAPRKTTAGCANETKATRRGHQEVPVCSSTGDDGRSARQRQKDTTGSSGPASKPRPDQQNVPEVGSTSSGQCGDNGDGMGQDLLSRSMKKLKEKQQENIRLSSKQLEHGQSRLKGLFNKMGQHQDSQHGSEPSPLSPVKETVETETDARQSSQDLFADQGLREGYRPSAATPDRACSSPPGLSQHSKADSEELPDTVHHDSIVIEDSRSPAHHTNVRQPTSRKPDLEGSENMGQSRRTLEAGGQGDLEDMETQPPEFMMLHGEEEELQFMEQDQRQSEGKGEGREDGARSSPVYPVQVTQPRPSSTQFPEISSSEHLSRDYISSPSKLRHIDEEDTRPLLHDYKFTWQPSDPPRLSGNYTQKIRYCPPTRKERQYTTVIRKMFDDYFLAFSQEQRRLQKLAWGNPVRTGQNVHGTLDAWKKSGQMVFSLEEGMDDDEDFDDPKPALRRHHTDSDAVRRERGGARKQESRVFRLVADDKGTVIAQEQGGQDADLLAMYKVQTQGDSDNDLPDILITSSGNVANAGGDGSQNANLELKLSQSQNDGGGKRIRSENQETRRSVTPIVAAPGGVCSQSSDSLLDENGDLFCTQLPHRKRKVDGHDEGPPSTSRPNNSKRACKDQTKPSIPADEDGSNAFQMKPLTRKRKPPTPADIGDEVYTIVDDDDFSATSSKRKVGPQAQQSDFLHISSSLFRGSMKSASVVRPKPRRPPQPGNGEKVDLRPQAKQRLLTDSGEGKPKPERQFCVILTHDRQTPPPHNRQPPKVHRKQAHENQPKTNLQHLQPDEEASNDSVQLIHPADKQEEVDGNDERESVEQETQPPQQMEPEPDVEPDIIGRISKQRAQLSQHNVQEESEDNVMCPLCSRLFSASQIAEHASDCQGPVDEDNEPQQQQPSTSQTAPYPTNQLKRQPLHGQGNRNENRCALCDAGFQRGSELEQHFTECLKRFQREQEYVPGTSTDEDSGFNRGGARVGYSTRASGRLQGYKIPKKGITAESVAAEIMEEPGREEGDGDDSDRDPDFAITKDDQRQEKEDDQEDLRMRNKGHDSSSSPEVEVTFKKQMHRRKPTRGAEKDSK